MGDFFKKAFDDMKSNAAAQHEIDKANFDAVKADSKARFEEAKKPDPDFAEFKEAKGFKAKVQVLISQAERNAKNMSEENRREYEAMLAEMRENMNNIK